MTPSASHGDPSRSAPATLATIEAALRACWDERTCDPVDLPWSSDYPSRGQCGVTALVLNDLLGGDLMVAEVLFPDGSRQGWHTWNVFGDGLEVDLTRDQFRADEAIQPGDRITRPPGRPSREPERYELLRDRVQAALSLDRLG
ncbi:MAG: hypothetical protein JNK12_12525 [Acidimicrobiales bacterium]|nr:hypothetical protein [Acidimicrobiales bacterium]